MADEDGHAAGDGKGGGYSTFGLIDGIDAALALVLILLCWFLYDQTNGFDKPALFLGDNVLPEEFPRMLFWIIGGLALLLPFEHLLEQKRHPLIRKARSAPIGITTWATIPLLIAILALAPTLGMILTILLASFTLPILWGERRWLFLALYSITFTAVITYIFAGVLSVYFEPGVFGITYR